MRTICTSLVISLAKLHLNYGGLVEGASARRFLVYGSSNLGQSTTSQRLEPLGGGYTNHHKEAVVMTTTPTQAVTTAMIYTVNLAGGGRALSDFKRIRTVSLVAQSELLARQPLSGLSLVFKSRTPRSQVAHEIYPSLMLYLNVGVSRHIGVLECLDDTFQVSV